MRLWTCTGGPAYDGASSNSATHKLPPASWLTTFEIISLPCIDTLDPPPGCSTIDTEIRFLCRPRRPNRIVVAERQRWAGPERWCLRQLEHGREVVQPAGRGLAGHRPALDLLWCEV